MILFNVQTECILERGGGIHGMVIHTRIKSFREEDATWVAVRLDKNQACYALVCFRFFLQVAYHIFTTSQNYQLYRGSSHVTKYMLGHPGPRRPMAQWY